MKKQRIETKGQLSLVELPTVNVDDKAVYTVEQIAKLMQLAPKTVRQYLKLKGYQKTVGNQYRLLGIEVVSFVQTIRNDK